MIQYVLSTTIVIKVLRMTGTHIESLKLWKTLEEHDGGGSWGFVHEYQSIGKVIKEYEKLTVSQYVIDYNTIMYKSQKNMGKLLHSFVII